MGMMLSVASVGCSKAPQVEPSEKSEKSETSEVQKDSSVSVAAGPAAADAKKESMDITAWFSEQGIEHQAVLQRQQTGKDADGSGMAFILLEMMPDDTSETCIEKFRAKLSPNIDLQEATAYEKQAGHLQMNGERIPYSVSVVCGQSKGKNTAYMSVKVSSSSSL